MHKHGINDWLVTILEMTIYWYLKISRSWFTLSSDNCCHVPSSIFPLSVNILGCQVRLILSKVLWSIIPIGGVLEAHVSYSTLELSHLRSKGVTVFIYTPTFLTYAWELLLEAWILACGRVSSINGRTPSAKSCWC